MSNASSDPAGDSIPLDAILSDTVDLAVPLRAIRATNAGNVQITTAAGKVRVCAFVASETRVIRATRVWSTNTTATGLEGMI